MFGSFFARKLRWHIVNAFDFSNKTTWNAASRFATIPTYTSPPTTYTGTSARRRSGGEPADSMRREALATRV